LAFNVREDQKYGEKETLKRKKKEEEKRNMAMKYWEKQKKITGRQSVKR
jgi:hypothetical protein